PADVRGVVSRRGIGGIQKAEQWLRRLDDLQLAQLQGRPNAVHRIDESADQVVGVMPLLRPRNGSKALALLVYRHSRILASGSVETPATGSGTLRAVPATVIVGAQWGDEGK